MTDSAPTPPEPTQAQSRGTTAPTPPDRIEARGIRAFGRHGVLEHERREGQEFVVDVSLAVDLARAGRTDDLAETVSYAEVAADVVAIVTGEPVDLIETVAQRIADACLRRPLVEAVEVTVHKPQAPVGVPFDDVAVTLRRAAATPVVIALGANLGDPMTTLDEAVTALSEGLDDVRVSTRFRTAPVGGPDQPDYVNAVLTGFTARSPRRMLAWLHEIEAAAGRIREVRWGPRTLDLDLIAYGRPGDADEVVSTDATLTLPHPRAHERAFVLAPWAQLETTARLRMPDGSLRAVVEVLSELDQSGVRPVAEETAAGGVGGWA
ncbi:MAG: 2-amino-4-hydroxy-6-hydroxymethyldihydropteridine diphosphokinase [Nostocoides sp.]